MNTIRNGKIARLPAEIREQLKKRMGNHESSTTLLAWLNALPAVQAVVTQAFGGKAVMRQNLSEWRHGGHAEWRREQAAQEMVKGISAMMWWRCSAGNIARDGWSLSASGRKCERLKDKG